MNKVNTIVICKEDYKTQEDFENALKKAIMVLLDNNYIMTVRYDEPSLGIAVIDFDNQDRNMDTPYPYWLTIGQAEMLEYYDGDGENDYE